MPKIRDDLFGVVLAYDENGYPVTLAPGDDVPTGVSVGAHVLGDTEPQPAKAKPKKAPEKAAVPNGRPDDAPPPKAGAGSGIDTWRAYAVTAATKNGLQIEIPDDAKRDEIIEALSDAGIPTE